jgi:NitT/TauT family transport system substrate-binding protein
VDYEITFFSKEELAIQAVINGQADLGVGTPYSIIQKSKAPMRILFQGTRLVFFPVVDSKYKTWKDLDGQPFTFHARGTGTEAIGNIIAKREGIKFGERSYVPGSNNRVVAMMAGQAKATILDLSNKNKIVAQAGDRFQALPMFEVKASDEALFANLDWIKNNEAAVNTFVDALQSTWADMAKDPTIIRRETRADGPIGQLPAEVLDSIDGFYKDAVEGGLYDPNGGGREAAKADMEWYTAAGQLEGDPATLNVEDFWYFAPLDAALKQ